MDMVDLVTETMERCARAGAREEREAVVRWLRRQEERYELSPPFRELVNRLSNDIAAGEHRKEGA